MVKHTAIATWAACLLAGPVLADDYCEYSGGTQAFRSALGCVSSHLHSQSGNRYVVQNLFDGNTATAWCEGAAGNGRGETITFEWSDAAPLQGLFITNGYTKSSDIWRKNNRIRDLVVTVWDHSWSGPRTTTIRLHDSPLEEQVTLPWHAPSPVRLELRIGSVYRGSKYQDTCVSELWTDFWF
jgi:hypothetical protein